MHGRNGHHAPDRRAHGPEAHNRGVLVMTVLSIAAAYALAAFAPAPLVLATFSGLLGLSAIATLMVAALMRQRPFASHLTLWDKAAILALVSMCAGLMVDSEAMRAFLEAHEEAASAEGVTAPAPG